MGSIRGIGFGFVLDPGLGSGLLFLDGARDQPIGQSVEILSWIENTEARLAERMA